VNNHQNNPNFATVVYRVLTGMLNMVMTLQSYAGSSYSTDLPSLSFLTYYILPYTSQSKEWQTTLMKYYSTDNIAQYIRDLWR
jgi:hypothetical protein